MADDVKGKNKYVALFNLKDTVAEIIFKPEWDLWKGNYKATECWTKESISRFDKELKAPNVPPHGVKIYKIEQL